MRDYDVKQFDKHEVVLFNSHSRSGSVVLSNFYPCTLTVDNVQFGSSEQLFQYLCFEGNDKVQEKILKAATPLAVKRLAKYYAPSCTITGDAQIPIMEFCLNLKNEQCPEFRQYLDAHPNDYFVEYAPWGDTMWGMTDTDSDLKNVWRFGEVYGRNVVGTIIGDIRDSNKQQPPML